ncbi:MAG: PAS domain-containing protein [Alphaproteobacteria bacterium]|nr:PAS domain-containing protein [Alphaproteobacteria bacterium]MBO6862293.1 PAS domain-containing protein [Alphaproteobacteria bacterium]
MNHPEGQPHGTNALDALSAFLKFPETMSVLAHWRALAETAEGHVPDRRSVDPTRIIGALPYVFIMDRETDSGRLRYRLAGERINSRYDYGIIGKYLDDITPSETIKRVQAYFDLCPTRPAVVLLSGVLYSERDKPGYGERLLLPLKDGKTGVKGLIGVTYQASLFPDSFAAMEQGERMLRVAPLHGGELEQSKAPLR